MSTQHPKYIRVAGVVYKLAAPVPPLVSPGSAWLKKLDRFVREFAVNWSAEMQDAGYDAVSAKTVVKPIPEDSTYVVSADGGVHSTEETSANFFFSLNNGEIDVSWLGFGNETPLDVTINAALDALDATWKPLPLNNEIKSLTSPQSFGNLK